jgi:hypothetical protein
MLLKGDAILTFDDSDVVRDSSKLTQAEHGSELDYLENGKIVLMKTSERYLNHSCDPNSYVMTIRHVRRLLAIRNVEENQEITMDYFINGYNEGTFACKCGSAHCRGVYQGDFFKLPLTLQTWYLPYLDSWFTRQFRSKINELAKKGESAHSVGL